MSLIGLFRGKLRKDHKKLRVKERLRLNPSKEKKSSHRYPIKDSSNKHLEKTRVPDPNNPFSVLMALKEK